MHLLVVAATVFEIRPYLKMLHLVKKTNDQLSRYRYKDTPVDVLITGVGMVPTAYFLGRQLAREQYDLAVNAGIAGTFNPSIPLGSVVNVVEDCVPELGAEDGDNFLSLFDLGLTDPDAHPYRGGRLVNDFPGPGFAENKGVLSKLQKVKAITSNTVHGNAASIQRIQRISGADIESMEGAAFFFACLSAGVACLQIRSVSNMVEERDKSRWNLDLALKNLNKFLRDLVNSVTAGN